MLVWGLGSRFGPQGSAAGYLLVIAALFVPGVHRIWRRYRHDPPGRIDGTETAIGRGACR
jgi:hypothetical protein